MASSDASVGFTCIYTDFSWCLCLIESSSHHNDFTVEAGSRYHQNRQKQLKNIKNDQNVQDTQKFRQVKPKLEAKKEITAKMVEWQEELAKTLESQTYQ